nr:hypothetical protein Iba_chr06fCG4590 [Ipomoea batatas]GMD98503.1 hypothetical protein Iba_chr15dCG3360 [Ipomoea batatas]GME20258.1 hypothetical protein Iba_scaffold24649CG0050 [Ipomoea batatas]
MAILCLFGSCKWPISMADLDSRPIISCRLQQKICIQQMVWCSHFQRDIIWKNSLIMDRDLIAVLQ